MTHALGCTCIECLCSTLSYGLPAEGLQHGVTVTMKVLVYNHFPTYVVCSSPLGVFLYHLGYWCFYTICSHLWKSFAFKNDTAVDDAWPLVKTVWCRAYREWPMHWSALLLTPQYSNLCSCLRCGTLKNPTVLRRFVVCSACIELDPGQW